MNKRFLIILGIIIGLIIVGLIVFWIFYPEKTEESITTGFGLFPGGGERIGAQPPAAGPGAGPPTIEAPQQKPLIQITQKAVSGATFTNGMVRYVEKATGNIYDISLEGSTSTKISSTAIPGIFEVHWSPDGKQAVVRYTEKNESGIEEPTRNFSITSIDATSASAKGVFLLSSIKTMASSPKESKIFYLASLDDTNLGITASFSDKSQRQVISTSFGEWLASWPSERVISLLTKPSGNVKGYLYKLDPVSGSFEKVLGDINGLTALWSSDGAYVLYGESGYSGLETNVYNIKNKSVADFSLTTLPEKCVWSKINKAIVYCGVPSALPAAKYPDDWYQGLISFRDKLWKIDVLKGTTEIIPFSAEMDFDIINPFFNKNEDRLFFQNKYDGTLWSLKLF